MRPDQALSLADLAHAARRRLPIDIHGHVDGGAEHQRTLEANRLAFGRWRFLTHPLVDVSRRSTAIDLFGRRYASPIGIAPMGVSGLCCFDGDVALARAAVQAGLPSVLSGAATIPLERVMKEAPGTWYQAYIPDRVEVIDPLLARLQRAGVEVLVVTVDMQIASIRANELRNGFAVPHDFTVLLDGGVRRGTDVLKAVALGAAAVFVGRPVMHGLAIGGHAGAAHALELLKREVDVDLALLGRADIQRLDAS